MSAAPPPVHFAFGVHIHQPVGNFDHVFREHVDEVYRPFLRRLAERDCHPITLHASGPLLDWLDTHDRGFVDEIGRSVADGRIELLASGRYEPILAVLSRADRVSQVEEMRALLASRFGVDATGLWLTERVWEQDLVVDLATAGIEYVLLDDRHLMAAGIGREALDRPWSTAADGARLTVLAIDERLRYLIPFRPVEEFDAFVRARRHEGTRLLVLVDDGEKFGGWPRTREWVYAGGWLDRFLDTIDRLRADGGLELTTMGEAARPPSAGTVYPAPGSYREMEEWTLPRGPARALERAREAAEASDTRPAEPEATSTGDPSTADPSIGDHPAGNPSALADPETSGGAAREGKAALWVRGGHWKNFLVRYAESGRMHAMAEALGRLCGEGGDAAAARAVARARCNDAYWHGIFGGIYLPFLRAAIWGSLAEGERLLRAGEGLEVEVLDWDVDGRAEVWVHSRTFSAIVSPARGGAIEVFQHLGRGVNEVDVLSRYREAYHGVPGVDPPWEPEADAPDPAESSARTASIHDADETRRFAPPGIDSVPRAWFQERIFEPAALRRGDGRDTDDPAEPPRDATLHDLASGAYELVAVEGPSESSREPEVRIVLRADNARVPLLKTFTWRADGALRVRLDWANTGLPTGSRVTTEVSSATAQTWESRPAADIARADIIALARSEQGFELIRQGESAIFAWPAPLGTATVEWKPKRVPAGQPGT